VNVLLGGGAMAGWVGLAAAVLMVAVIAVERVRVLPEVLITLVALLLLAPIGVLIGIVSLSQLMGDSSQRRPAARSQDSRRLRPLAVEASSLN